MRESKQNSEDSHQAMDQEKENMEEQEVEYLFDQYCRVEQEILDEWQQIRKTLEKIGLGNVVRLLKIDKDDPRKSNP
jgi:hypothetical protein